MMEPIGKNVVVAIEYEETDGLIIQDKAKEPSQVVTVKAIGDAVEYIAVGDKVIVPFVGGSIVDDVRIIHSDDIMGIVYD